MEGTKSYLMKRIEVAVRASYKSYRAKDYLTMYYWYEDALSTYNTVCIRYKLHPTFMQIAEKSLKNWGVDFERDLHKWILNVKLFSKIL